MAKNDNDQKVNEKEIKHNIRKNDHHVEENKPLTHKVFSDKLKNLKIGDN